MKDKHKIELTLRVFKMGHLTEDEAVDYIMKFYSSSKIFNNNSFWWGWAVGGIVTLIVYYFTK